MSHPRIVTDQELEKALDWLRDSANDVGEAKRRSVLASNMLRHIKALEMKKHDGSAAAQEREAYASDAYKRALYEDAVAAGEYEKMKALREAAALKIQAWQTESANYRSMKI